jgi:hypothetical protein
VSTITEWLASHGLSKLERLSAENRSDDTSFVPHLTDQALKELGIPLSHRLKMLAAIGQLAGAAVSRTTPLPSPAPEPKPQDSAERRQPTIMFSDLVGSPRSRPGSTPRTCDPASAPITAAAPTSSPSPAVSLPSHKIL